MNPMPKGMDILINEINKEMDIGVLTAWTEEMEDKIWINAKTSNLIEFQLQHGEWKEGLPLEEQIPKEYHIWTSSMRTRLIDFPPLDLGITRLS